jgi:amino acid adenylation domain-containing protein
LGKINFAYLYIYITHPAPCTSTRTFVSNRINHNMAELTASPFPQLLPADNKVASTVTLHYTVSQPRFPTGMTHLAAHIQLGWSILVGKYTDALDVGFGLTLRGLSAQPKHFPIRFHINSDETIEQALAAIHAQAVAMDSFETAADDFHSDLIIEKSMAIEDEPCRPLSRPCALTVVCRIHGGLSAGDASNLRFTVHYDPQVMETVEVLRTMHQLKHILQQLTQTPQAKLRDLDLISPEDWATLRDWNAELPRVSQTTLHELAFYHRDSRPAIIAWDGEMTYHQLNQASMDVAQHLVRSGIRHGMFIPFCMEKSQWAVVTILTIFRVGAVCVPIDPNIPAGRAREMIEDMGAQVLVASAAQRPRMEELGIPILVVPEVAVPTDLVAPLPLPAVHPEDLALVLFTSGTTGRPKGMLIEHCNIATSLLAIVDTLNVHSTTLALHFASYSFDLAIYEIICTLYRGGCLCIPSESQRLNDLAGFMREQQVTWAAFTPSLFSLTRPDDLPMLQTVALGGEAIPPSIVQTWAPRVQLVNMYGPTETSICSVGRIPQDRWRVGTIGPMTGGRGWITAATDPEQLVPLGAIGELLVEGPIVVGGYLNRPASLTAEAFINAPSWLRRFRSSCDPAGIPGRLYRTGDLVRYTGQGWIQFVGRRDTQVKVRGQRLELGEVEHRVREVFSSAPDVVVELVPPSAGRPSPILVAFIPVQQDDVPLHNAPTMLCEISNTFQSQMQEASAALRDLLPTYMIPSLFVPVTHLPRTITAKTDRAQLRRLVIDLRWRELEVFFPDRSSSLSNGEGASSCDAQSQELQILVTVVANVLACDMADIRTDESFLSLGGDSLSAMKLVGLARTAGLTLSVLSVLRSPSLQELAKPAAAPGESPQQSLPETATGQEFSRLGVNNLRTFLAQLVLRLLPQTQTVEEIEDVLPATPRQEYLSDFSCEYLLLRLQGPTDHARLQQACKRLVHYHPILRTVFVRSGDQMHQVVLRSPAVMLPVHSPPSEKKADANASALEWCQTDSIHPVDPSKLSVRFLLFQGGTRDENVLVLRYSRSLFDPETVPILYRGLQELYEDRTPPPAVSFPAFVYHALGQDRTAEFSFWRCLLRDSEMTQLPSPTVTDDGPQLLFAPLMLPAIKPAAGITAATVVKAAWALALADHTGQSDIVFTQIVSGRSMPIVGIEKVVGPCNRILPVRASLPSDRSRGNLLLHQLHAQHIDSLAFQGVYLRDIIQHSTSWPADTRMGSIVLHQNIEYPAPFAMGNLQCTPSYFNAPPHCMPLTVVSIAQELGHQIVVTCSKDVADQASLDALSSSVQRHMAALQNIDL